MNQISYKPHATGAFMYEEMLPCPFCNGEPKLTFIGSDYTKRRKVQIRCNGCRITLVNAGINTGSEKLAKWSIDDWNKRHQ